MSIDQARPVPDMAPDMEVTLNLHHAFTGDELIAAVRALHLIVEQDRIRSGAGEVPQQYQGDDR